MPNKSESTSVDLQKVLTGAVALELKVVKAGIDYWQTWMNQAAKLSDIAGDTLEAIRGRKATASGTARRLNEFGKENARVFTNLSSRLSERYFSELGRLAEALETKERKASPASKPKRTTRKKKRAAKSGA
jgi:hypothetical protein